MSIFSEIFGLEPFVKTRGAITRFVETQQGDIIDAGDIKSVRYWPPNGPDDKHRVQLETASGAVWLLYNGISQSQALQIRDEMKARVRTALR